jgi:hypothetical protein
MPDDVKGQITRFWQGLRKKTEETVARREIAFARDKVAGKTVTDDAGGVIVEAGHRIDDAVIERAAAAGKLHALAAAVVTAEAQDLKEKAETYLASTPEGKEARALDTVGEYARARRYVGHISGLDVTDIRGTVIVPAGKEITEQDVRAARDANLLAALIYSAQQPPPPKEDMETRRRGDAETKKPVPEPQQPVARRSLPLVTPPEEKKE